MPIGVLTCLPPSSAAAAKSVSLPLPLSVPVPAPRCRVFGLPLPAGPLTAIFFLPNSRWVDNLLDFYCDTLPSTLAHGALAGSDWSRRGLESAASCAACGLGAACAHGLEIRSLVVTHYLALLSRKAETEADVIGIQLMARACFDPSGAQRRLAGWLRLWLRTIARSGQLP